MNRPLTVVIVDADGIGKFLPAALAHYGVQSVHVRSGAPDAHLSRQPTGIEVEVRHDGDLAVTAAALRPYGVGFVVAGAESGVLLADALSAALGTPGNGMTRPLARRDKYEMAQAVGEAGLATAETFATTSADNLVAWALRLGEWPVVVKPLTSSGSDNVLFCRSAAGIHAAFETIMAATDRYRQRNSAVLGQRYLRGDEYFVNTVSRGGVHHLVDVWRYHKRLIDGHPMYDYEEPIPPEDPAVAPIVSYTLAVLDALEIRNGAAHTEVMLTPDGPVLVECAARSGGSHAPTVVSRCLGTSQIECLALAIARPEAIIEGRLPQYRLRTHLRYVTLISPRDGVVPSAEDLAPARALGSFTELVLTTPEGTPTQRTVDQASSPGYVYLSSPDPAQVQADYQRLRSMEENGLYESRSGMR
jgi:biotin carboxylase